MGLNGLPSKVMHPPAVTLTFDLLITKSNQHIYEPKYICDQNWMKSCSVIFDMVFTRFSGRTDSHTHSRTDRLNDMMPPAPF